MDQVLGAGHSLFRPQWQAYLSNQSPRWFNQYCRRRTVWLRAESLIITCVIVIRFNGLSPHKSVRWTLLILHWAIKVKQTLKQTHFLIVCSLKEKFIFFLWPSVHGGGALGELILLKGFKLFQSHIKITNLTYLSVLFLHLTILPLNRKKAKKGCTSFFGFWDVPGV